MSILSKRPSELADMYTSAAKNPQKASDWYYDYSIKSNYINITELDTNKHWEGKGTAGKLEFVINVAKLLDKPLEGKYPMCELCLENEGYAPLNRHNMRTIPLELCGKPWFWQFVKRGIIGHHSLIVNNDHLPHTDVQMLAALFDYNDLVPHYFIGCLGKGTQPKSQQHQHFEGGYKTMPLFKAKSLVTYRSSLYPLVEISQVEWYCTTLRIVGADRRRIIDCGQAILQAWSHVDTGNWASVCVRRDKEGKSILEIILHRPGSADSQAWHNVKADGVSLMDMLGVVELRGSLDSELTEIERFLTKEVKLVMDKLPAHLQQHASMIAKLVKDAGSSKTTALEAQLMIRDELHTLIESMLSNHIALDDKAMQSFLDKLGCAVIK
jgi:UDPglucose--hexose-1-phosphate uridylyltransferase